MNANARILPASLPASIDEAVHALREGGLVCYPTDTVYGIGAAATNEEAVRRLYAVKGRATDKPLPILLADPTDAIRVAEVTPLGRTLISRFWPGQLTIVMHKAPGFRSFALAKGETVAVRVPDNAVVQDLAGILGEPITGTSANRSGARPPVSAAEVAFQIGGLVDLILDGGPARARTESTVIDITQEPPVIVREGAVSREELERAIGQPVGPAT